MRKLHLVLLAALVMALPSMALEPRTFYNTDKTKSFKATLTDYDATKKTVTVVYASGVKKVIPMRILSKECQDYVLENQDLLVISKSVRLKFKEVKVKGVGNATATGYAIEVYNSGKRPVEDVKLKYTLYYNQGDLIKGGTVAKTTSGTLSTGKLFDSDTMTVETQKVDIIRKMQPSSSG